MKHSLEEAEEIYAKLTAGKVLFILGTLIGIVAIAFIAVYLGAANLSVKEVFDTIVAKIFPFMEVESSKIATAIVWKARLPRIVMAIVAGAGLAVSGAAMQGTMKNPLVSPYTIGIVSAAAFGASIAMVLGAGLLGSGRYLVIMNAFIFAVLDAFLIYGIAKIRGVTAETLILAGIALMFLFSGLTSFLQYVASEEELAAVVHWMFGSLCGTRWEDVYVAGAIFLSCLPFLMKYSWDLNAMALGDEIAITSGVDTNRVRIFSLVLATLITAGIICFTGIIAFVGIVAPHIVRLIIGGDHRFLLPCSCLLGALLLLVADTIGRTIVAPIIIPVGIIFSFIGVPFFLYLVMTKRKEYWG
ncbi:MAG: iron ABC transporter permease [Euryarchaeota archaeon]|nr:iron ABC transporter permease [Euryarchaeota archaeon]